jgi:hypothetical protein
MVMSLPKLRRPRRADLPFDRIKLPELPDRAALAERVKVPELPDINLPDLRQISLPEMPDIDLSGLPQRFPWKRRRAIDRASGITPAAITLLAIALSGIAGAVAAYFFDPDRGRRRRSEAANRVAGLGRQARRRVDALRRSKTSIVGSNAVVGSDGDSTRLAPEKSPLNGEVVSPNGTTDDLVPANPGL